MAPVRRAPNAGRKALSQFEKLERLEEQTRVEDQERLRRGEATPEELQQENNPFTEAEMRTFKTSSQPCLPTQDEHAYPITTAHDFKDFVRVTDRRGEPAIVVGGHAVSIWAMYFQDEESELAKMGPFTSKDMDFVGDRTTALQLSWMVNEPAERAPKHENTPVLYRIKLLFADPARKNSTLEVLSYLPGVSNRELRSNSVIIQSQELGVRVRLPSPITCLKAKADNLVRLKQEKRRDLPQVHILMLCCRAFLRHFIKLAESGQITEGMVLAQFESFWKWTQSRTAKIAATRHRLNWREAFPRVPLERTSVPSLQSFFRANFQKTIGG